MIDVHDNIDPRIEGKASNQFKIQIKIHKY